MPPRKNGVVSCIERKKYLACKKKGIFIIGKRGGCCSFSSFKKPKKGGEDEFLAGNYPSRERRGGFGI